MAANDYYHGQQQPPYNKTPSPPAPYSSYQGRDTPSPQSTPTPAYQQSAYPPPAPSYTASSSSNPLHGPQSNHPTQSPFDTVFDDHAYPAQSTQSLNQGIGAGGSSSDMSQHEPQQYAYYGQDTSYYSQHDQGHSHSHGQPYLQQDIPLQDRPNKDPEMNDHIYDAPGGGQGSSGRKKKKGKVRLGELGMLGSDKKRIPWVVYIFSLIQVGLFIGEIVRNAILTGSPIMIKPQFNPMIGPSTQVLINMGARYAPCMHNVQGIQDSTIEVLFLCPNATKMDQTCPLSELCGFGGGVPNPNFDGNGDQSPEPNQWWRFIIPIFMHAGLIHIGFNLLLQLTIAKEMEMAIGSIRFFLVYMAAGIFGFVMGGNYAAPGIASTGASGSLFGIIALTLLDLLYSWKERKSPVKDLMFIILDMVIAFALGLLPGLDNFSHIGGFLTGLAVGVCVLHSPNSLRRKIGDGLSYATVSENTGETPPPFIKNPVGFFKGRKPLWWAWWLIRAGFLVMIIIVFIVLINNFYTNHKTCEWCKYLSCIPVNGWCDIGTIKEQS